MISLIACYSVCRMFSTGNEECYVNLRQQCEPYEYVCKETNTRKCKNVVQTIGPNDIVTNDKDKF